MPVGEGGEEGKEKKEVEAGGQGGKFPVSDPDICSMARW